MTPTPDALFLPESFKQGRTQYERLHSISRISDLILGVDHNNGERSWIRVQPGKHLFITKDPHDTIYFPTTHPLAGRPRYDWVAGDGGIRRGYLVPEAKE